MILRHAMRFGRVLAVAILLYVAVCVLFKHSKGVAEVGDI